MKFFSTQKNSEPVGFNQAVVNGLAVDGGLYMPEFVPGLALDFWKNIGHFSFHSIAENMIYPFLSDEWDIRTIREMIEEAFNFEAPLRQLDEQTYVMELFHGPTLAFKDFGARFMASIFNKMTHNKRMAILVATSGDTGSAVAQGFQGTDQISVYLLYPRGKVSKLQEQQLTTSGNNVTAIEVDGTFDDCQYMVKQAFSDATLRNEVTLSSANSINFARLLPQSVYYAYALAQLRIKMKSAPVFSVPSGNMGNVTGGILAMKMGMPVEKFVIATNINDVVPQYLQEGYFEPRPSIRTISNAMDVGNPSNLDRIRYLFDDNLSQMKAKISGVSFTDVATRAAIRKVHEKTGYILDPHTAVGYLASDTYRKQNNEYDRPVIIMSTAHPAKFKDIVEPLINREIEVPERLKECMSKKKMSVPMEASYDALKNFLMMQTHYQT